MFLDTENFNKTRKTLMWAALIIISWFLFQKGEDEVVLPLIGYKIANSRITPVWVILLLYLTIVYVCQYYFYKAEQSRKRDGLDVQTVFRKHYLFTLRGETAWKPLWLGIYEMVPLCLAVIANISIFSITAPLSTAFKILNWAQPVVSFFGMCFISLITIKAFRINMFLLAKHTDYKSPVHRVDEHDIGEN